MILGLTGGIASGKTTIMEVFKKNGFDCIYTDELAKKLMSEKLINELSKDFGKAISNNKEIDFKKLSQIIFLNKEMQLKLNNIVHPEVKKEIKKLINNSKNNVIIEVPLLYEAKYMDLFDKIIVSYLDKETQIKRLMKRNSYKKEEALIRINSQMDLETKKTLADFVIYNTRDLKFMEAQVIGLIGFLRNEDRDGSFNYKRKS